MRCDKEPTDEGLEAQRLATLKGLQLLDTPPEQEFDTIAATAKRLLRCKIALISLVDDKRQWFKAKYGLGVEETPRALASLGTVAETSRIALETLKGNQRQLRQAERMANIGSWRYTLADGRLEWSDQVYAMHGVPVEKTPIPGSIIKYYPPGSRELLSRAIGHTVNTGESFDFEVDFMTAQGQPRRGRSKGDLEIKDGKPVAIIGAFQDITEQHLMAQQLRQTAYTDEVTGLARRVFFDARIEQEIAMARHRASALALLCIDLDKFKQVNDRFGHAAGDQLLRDMAHKLRAPYLEGSLAARLGGDEFAILISCPRQLADLRGLLATLLLDLRHTVGKLAHKIDVTATIGACLLDDNIYDQAAFMKKADAALYEAKRRKRGAAIIACDRRLIDPSGPDLRLVRS